MRTMVLFIVLIGQFPDWMRTVCIMWYVWSCLVWWLERWSNVLNPRVTADGKAFRKAFWWL